jgi:hypothetical protein
MTKAKKLKLNRQLKRQHAQLIKRLRYLLTDSMTHGGSTFSNILTILDGLIAIEECKVPK